MLEFEVNDMTCGHCVSAITKAVQAAAPQAQLDIKLDSHRVLVNGAPDATVIEAAIREAGYSPVRV
ncbi:heavy-metal-associated domain-containing protein [Pusillimonas sp. MFBS29]|uniref:heavy-metal-associated domain-containing protein n=1 Tax=Pusillimonas sp. MFBS29 TaxID=2886690 RepID=UPI001D124593|nr:heavy-metal-associated domain-containing protein [Pusillimonas sp. MFBS29]MCC2595563.1 heavy-metal-associated domain-containing protein [Pusillimonas sp. MFBS29]